MPQETQIKISDAEVIRGDAPIVLIGPNGSGKTRLANDMASLNHADMIAALRNIALPTDVSMQSEDRARTELEGSLNRRRSQPWELSNEINQLFSKLMAEDAAAAVRFRDHYVSDPSVQPETTKLMRLQESWSRLFPGRSIDFAGYRPRVRSTYASAGTEYPAQQMSDGERVALYLAGRVIDSNAKIIIVDEPEVHFHSRLAVRFWNELELARDDCRFVYITHDLAFALSRHGATFVLVMPDSPPQVVPLELGIPPDLAESLLSAASFAIHAKHIVFCEGVEGRSIDPQLYSAWFAQPETAVIPMESAGRVTQCVAAFSNGRLVTGVDAIGIVDRDYWPERYLQSLPQLVSPLPLHEVENLLCTEPVYLAIALHLGCSAADGATRYSECLLKARAKFANSLFNKQVSERFRRRCEHEFNLAINSLHLAEDISAVQANHVETLKPEAWQSPPTTIFAEETTRLRNALNGTPRDFLTYFPGKDFLSSVAESLGMKTQAYVDLICSALASPKGHTLEPLGAKLQDALSEFLPPRTASPMADIATDLL